MMLINFRQVETIVTTQEQAEEEDVKNPPKVSLL
jgi:hypothetical protein